MPGEAHRDQGKQRESNSLRGHSSENTRWQIKQYWIPAKPGPGDEGICPTSTRTKLMQVEKMPLVRGKTGGQQLKSAPSICEIERDQLGTAFPSLQKGHMELERRI